MKSLVHLCIVFLLALASCTRAAEPGVAAKDAAKRKKVIAAEIQRRQALIKAAKAGLAREFVKKRKAQDHKMIKDLLGLLREFRASEAADLLCQNIEYMDPKFPIGGTSTQPRELRYPVTGVLESIGNPARKDLIKRLGKAKWASGRILLLTTLVNIMGEDAVRKEIEKGSLRKAKDAKELKRLMDLMHPKAPVPPARK